MQNLISQTGKFTFIDGNTDEGMIVSATIFRKQELNIISSRQKCCRLSVSSLTS